jgi:putative endonuclease
VAVKRLKNIVTGKKGEDVAAKFLTENKRMKILARNYRFDRAEIDIVALDGRELVFVEVKTRRNKNFGEPERAVTYGKLEQIKKAAENFIIENEAELDFDAVRIDVVAILLNKDSPEIEHFENVS